jgi:hypothetical protein
LAEQLKIRYLYLGEADGSLPKPLKRTGWKPISAFTRCSEKTYIATVRHPSWNSTSPCPANHPAIAMAMAMLTTAGRVVRMLMVLPGRGLLTGLLVRQYRGHDVTPKPSGK